jgi:hypothetical protein
MNDADLLAFILRVFRASTSAHDFIGSSGDLCWRTDGEYAPVTFFFNCNDLFYWACADCEDLTPENIDVWEQAIADCKAANETYGTIWADSLFCCRVRGERPQNCCYPKDHPELWPLFDACGPERTDDHTKRPVGKESA